MAAGKRRLTAGAAGAAAATATRQSIPLIESIQLITSGLISNLVDDRSIKQRLLARKLAIESDCHFPVWFNRGRYFIIYHSVNDRIGGKGILFFISPRFISMAFLRWNVNCGYRLGLGMVFPVISQVGRGVVGEWKTENNCGRCRWLGASGRLPRLVGHGRVHTCSLASDFPIGEGNRINWKGEPGSPSLPPSLSPPPSYGNRGRPQPKRSSKEVVKKEVKEEVEEGSRRSLQVANFPLPRWRKWNRRFCQEKHNRFPQKYQFNFFKKNCQKKKKKSRRSVLVVQNY